MIIRASGHPDEANEAKVPVLRRISGGEQVGGVGPGKFRVKFAVKLLTEV